MTLFGASTALTRGTLNAVHWAHAVGLRCGSTPRSLATTPGPARRRDRTSGRLDIVLWSVFFLVPTGRGQATDLISAEEFEQVFEKLHSTS